jgi:glutathione S-transferase
MSLSNRFYEPATDGHSGRLPLRLHGAIGSPYSMKMLFLLRFRRIPHRWCTLGSYEEAGSQPPPVHKSVQHIAPRLTMPDDSSVNDSTPMLRHLEREYRGRSVLPQHPGLGFLNDLLEDFADEFVTKAMYHYRWLHDPAYASKMLALGTGSVIVPVARAAGARGPDAVAMANQGHAGTDAYVSQFADMFRERQVSRLAVVGSNAATAPAIERAHMLLIARLDAHFASGHRFLLGSRPASADFALLGQLYPMIALDLETGALHRRASDRVTAWHHLCCDLSGLSIHDETHGWLVNAADADAADAASAARLPPTLLALLRDVVGACYAPFMIANARAIAAAESECAFPMRVDDGRGAPLAVEWRQPAFKYQAKCLAELRASFARLSAEYQRWVQAALAGTGCEALLPASAGGAEIAQSVAPRGKL